MLNGDTGSFGNAVLNSFLQTDIENKKIADPEIEEYFAKIKNALNMPYFRGMLGV